MLILILAWTALILAGVVIAAVLALAVWTQIDTIGGRDTAVIWGGAVLTTALFTGAAFGLAYIIER